MITGVIVLISYLVGSIPFGAILVFLSGNGNIKKLGSGNIGATNVLRTGKVLLAFITLLFDTLKGFIVVYTLQNLQMSSHNAYASAISLIVGHMFPVWLLFKGGKGVATFLGTLIALNYMISIVFFITWIIVFLIFRYSSLSSLIALTVATAILYYHEPSIYCIISFFLITIKHHSNIKRLLNNTEYKFKIFKK